jgi:hypothetical protein
MREGGLSLALLPIVGIPGSFKTSFLTAWVYDFYSADGGGWDVMANYTLKFPKERGCGRILDFDLRRLGDAEDTLRDLKLALDEIWVPFDSRRSSSNDNVEGTRILLQTRKKGCDVSGTMQGYSQVDRRFRNNAPITVLMKRRDFSLPYGEVWLYDTLTLTPLMPRPLPMDFTPVFPLFDTDEIKGSEWSSAEEVPGPPPVLGQMSEVF